MVFRMVNVMCVSLCLGLACSGVLGIPIDSLASSPGIVVSNIEEYFPDQKGNEWTYRGRFIDGTMVQIAEKSFTNVSTVIGTEMKDGVELTVFHDTNPGDQGPSDSYYRRDAAGIRYFGSKPGTTLEKQLVPYQIIRFPLTIPNSFQQLNRKGLNLGLDLDRDGQTEKVDVQATVSVEGQETVTVPLGTYAEAIRVVAHMTMNVHLSGLDTVVHGTDTMTAWFGRGIGLLKYEERQTIPSLRSENDRLIEVIEELEQSTLQEPTILGSRSESATKRVLTNHAFDQKLP
ncbi:MAG: hypothetical protein MRJ96_16310 [Nitrospirales bacterium]|nr:hypothetical protein [Nitrospira sp.]MDR4503007.1 hypothetical protein [Nitrospirales bacterium]